MTQMALPNRSHTLTGLRTETRRLHTPRVIWLNPGWLCVAAAVALSVLGVAAISTTQPGFAIRHLALLCVGVMAGAMVALPHFRWFRVLSYPLMLTVLGLLVFVLIPFVPDAIVHPRNGARRWINLGVTDFQPSELAKIAYIIALAGYLRFRSNYRQFRGLLVPLGLSFIPVWLILSEPDLGTAMLFLPTFFAMMIGAGAKFRHILLIMLIGLAAAPAMYPILQSHQKDRIQALFYQLKGDTRFEKGIGMQGLNAERLVGAGGWTGVGKEHAADLVEFNKLPEEHNDMIFAVVCCRWGLVGGAATWGLFLLFTLGGLLASWQCRDPFGRLVALGIVAMLFTQMTINTAMTIGLLPITGMTLPFVSYGGSSLVATWLMVGILLNIAMRRNQFMQRESFEFDEDDARIA